MYVARLCCETTSTHGLVYSPSLGMARMLMRVSFIVRAPNPCYHHHLTLLRPKLHPDLPQRRWQRTLYRPLGAATQGYVSCMVLCEAVLQGVS